MPSLLKILLLIGCLCPVNSGTTQVFMNGDLNGNVDFVSVPTSWLQIPYTDPISQANSIPEATVDVVDGTGPSAMGGVAGLPFSGATFCSGLHSTDGNLIWHEGIMQTVNGFTVGSSYTVGFRQTVLKQTNSIDQSGSWRVYIDGGLIATTPVSFSALSPVDVNLTWDYRSVNFTATSPSHTLQFIPWDDDSNLLISETDSTGALRMGIDSIHFVIVPPVPPSVDLGNDTVLCVGNTLVLDATNPSATYIWQDNSTNPTYLVTQPGTYWVTVSNSSGMASDTIHVDFESAPFVDLGNDLVACQDTFILLNVGNSNASYVWQDNSTASTLLVSETGMYSVTLSTICGTASDSVHVDFLDCSVKLEMPNVFTPNSDGLNDFFVPVKFNGIAEAKLLILNRWGTIVHESRDLSEGWNGKSNGLDCLEGVYFWLLDYTNVEGFSAHMYGSVHLRR